MLGQEKVYILIEKKEDVERSAPKTSTGFGQDVAQWRRSKDAKGRRQRAFPTIFLISQMMT